MEKHQVLVAELATRIRAFHLDGVRWRIFHGSTNSTRPSSRQHGHVVDTRALAHVLLVDPVRKVAVVEPNVSMARLVEATLHHGLVPAVVPEFPAITVGGAFAGTAAESSSFRHGYFDQTIGWVEMILADGAVVHTSPTENADLFYGAAGACGTLGLATLFELQLVETGRFVEVTYIPVHSFGAATRTIDEACASRSWDYVDGILFSQNCGTIVVARRAMDADLEGGRRGTKDELPIARFQRRCDQWFYLHAHKQTPHLRHSTCDTCPLAASRPAATSSKPAKELVPIKDYFFRYDRGGFWMGSYGLQKYPLLFNRVGRFLLDPIWRTDVMYRAMHRSGRSQSFIIQDLAIPRHNVEAFLRWSHDKLHLYPLWLCPIRSDTKAPLHLANGLRSLHWKDEEESQLVGLEACGEGPQISPVQCSNIPARYGSAKVTTPTKLNGVESGIINVGLWGVNTASWPDLTRMWDADRFMADNRAIEAEVRALGGLKWLYAHQYHSEDEFWEVYDQPAYDALREKWRATELPNLFEKVKSRGVGDERVEKEKSTPFGVAVLLALLGRDHLLRN